MYKRGVWLGTRRIGGGVARHWAIKVGNSWYELDGDGVANKGEGTNTINGGIRNAFGHLIDPCGKPTFGEYSRSGAGSFLRLVTTTFKLEKEIHEFNQGWLQNNPDYHMLASNCQKYATEVAKFLSEDGCFRLLIPEGGTIAYAAGPGAYTIGTDGTHVAVASTGKASAGDVIFVEVEGPNAGVAAGNGNNEAYVGAMAKAALARVEARLGPARLRFEPNVDTGVGIIDGNLEIKLLGIGFSVGSNGIGISTFFGGINVG